MKNINNLEIQVTEIRLETGMTASINSSEQKKEYKPRDQQSGLCNKSNRYE